MFLAPNEVALDRRTAEALVDYALVVLQQKDAYNGCCPRRCGVCSALVGLLGADQLDDLARAKGPGAAWWDAERRR